MSEPSNSTDAGRKRWTRRLLAWLKDCKPVFDFVAFVVAAIGTFVGVREFFQNHHLERREAAEHAYREVNDKFVDLMHLCLEHPRLECYSNGKANEHPEPTADDRMQQERLDGMFADVLELAHTRYYDRWFQEAINRGGRDEQWLGWLSSKTTDKPVDKEESPPTGKLCDDWQHWLSRTKNAVLSGHFRERWCSKLRDEYSSDFQEFMMWQMIKVKVHVCTQDETKVATSSPQAQCTPKP
jgi:hypothetical protein